MPGFGIILRIINWLKLGDMIRFKDHRTSCLFDPWEHLRLKRRKLMEQSWAGLFRPEILGELPVDKIAARFSSGWGQPYKELYAMLGVLCGSRCTTCPMPWVIST